MDSKRCSYCKVSRPLSEFFGDCTSPDKKGNTCRSCKATVSREDRQRRRERLARGEKLPRQKTREDLFWEKVDRSGGPGACWLWTATRNQTGNGIFAASRGHGIAAHRMAYQLSRGIVLPPRSVVHQTCGKPDCCQPAHLELVVRPTLEERFWSKVERRGDDDCWIWRGKIEIGGYGIMWVDDRDRRATHIALQLADVEIPRGMVVCHHCDNPPCVNPRHLFVGTQYDNMRDMRRKGRNPTSEQLSALRRARGYRGERNPSAKLTEQDVQAIRASNASATELGRRYGVTTAAICRVLLRQTWSHLPE